MELQLPCAVAATTEYIPALASSTVADRVLVLVHFILKEREIDPNSLITWGLGSKNLLRTSQSWVLRGEGGGEERRREGGGEEGGGGRKLDSFMPQA